MSTYAHWPGYWQATVRAPSSGLQAMSGTARAQAAILIIGHWATRGGASWRVIGVELGLSFFITGVILLAVVLRRMARYRGYAEFQRQFEARYDVSGIDLSGNTEYTGCFSQQWVYDRMTLANTGGMARALDAHVTEHTLAATIWLALTLGIGTMLIGLLVLTALRTIGMAITVFFAGVVVVMGPSGPKASEDLMRALIKKGIDGLSREDYAYIRIANWTILKWAAVQTIIGLVLIVGAPVADAFPTAVAIAISTFAFFLIWGPTILLLNIWFPLGLIYLALSFPFFFYMLPKKILELSRRMRGIEEEEGTRPAYHF